MIAWRLVQPKLAHQAFLGEGARLFGGRWNYPGTPLVYLSENISLCMLEILVNLNSLSLLEPRYTLCKIQFTPSLIDTVPESDFPKNWRNAPGSERLKQIGANWIQKGKTPLLRVPSAVVPNESNVLFNPLHIRTKSVKILKNEIFQIDKRLIHPSKP